ncbi:hypothetical protein [Rhodococcus sp. O3]|uniref:hypothetical protein n=1 Tax=Rhodococcus sp. O3 TaxID=3404919 RepID=UPI003B66B406
MTTPTTALPTGYTAEIDGATALVIGHAHSFPRHPQRGAPVQPFGGTQTSISATRAIDAPLYALVSVEWATEVTTIEPGGSTRTMFAKGWLGTRRAPPRTYTRLPTTQTWASTRSEPMPGTPRAAETPKYPLRFARRCSRGFRRRRRCPGSCQGAQLRAVARGT